MKNKSTPLYGISSVLSSISLKTASRNTLKAINASLRSIRYRIHSIFLFVLCVFVFLVFCGFVSFSLSYILFCLLREFALPFVIFLSYFLGMVLGVSEVGERTKPWWKASIPVGVGSLVGTATGFYSSPYQPFDDPFAIAILIGALAFIFFQGGWYRMWHRIYKEETEKVAPFD